MSLFEDKQYQEMDWLARAVEPMVSVVNTILSELPDRHEFLGSEVGDAINNSEGRRINALMLLNRILPTKYAKDKFYNNKVQDHLGRCFTIEKEGNLTYYGAPLLKVKGDGKVILKKTKAMFDDAELKAIIIDSYKEHLWHLNLQQDIPTMSRINEILELIEGTEALRNSRSVNRKVQGLVTVLSDIIVNDKWKVKNVELAERVGLWVTTYIQSGNLAALTNFCAFKIMTHFNNPIYSMEAEAI